MYLNKPLLFLFLSLISIQAFADFEIHDPAIVNIRPYEVTVEWTTSQPSRSWVEYGESEKLGLRKESLEFSDGHSVKLNPLKSKTSYTFKIFAKDKNGKEFKTNFYEFRTEDVDSQDSTILKIISPPEVTGVSSYKAIISWETNKPSDSTVIYGIKGLKPKSYVSALNTPTHIVTLDNLSPNSRYFYQVVASDDQGHEIKSSYSSFVTVSQKSQSPPPFILEGPAIAIRAFDRVKIEWSSDRPCQSFISWGKIPLPSFHKKLDVSRGFSKYHIFELNNLEQKTRYFYVIHQIDRNTLKSSSEIYSFQTTLLE